MGFLVGIDAQGPDVFTSVYGFLGVEIVLVLAQYHSQIRHSF